MFFCSFIRFTFHVLSVAHKRPSLRRPPRRAREIDFAKHIERKAFRMDGGHLVRIYISIPPSSSLLPPPLSSSIYTHPYINTFTCRIFTFTCIRFTLSPSDPRNHLYHTFIYNIHIYIHIQDSHSYIHTYIHIYTYIDILT